MESVQKLLLIYAILELLETNIILNFELVDIGVNLDHRSFDKDRAEVLRRAWEVGVKTLILTGTTVKSSQAVLELTRQEGESRLFSTAGVHPHNARQCDDRTIPQLRKLAASDRVVAIGECGLDFDRDFSPRPEQERWFEAQLELACELHKPVFLHERSAHSRFRGNNFQIRYWSSRRRGALFYRQRGIGNLPGSGFAHRNYRVGV